MKKLILCVSLVLLVFTKVSAQSDSSKHVLFFGEQHYLSGNIKILEYIKRQDTSNIDLVMEISPSEAFVISYCVNINNYKLYNKLVVQNNSRKERQYFNYLFHYLKANSNINLVGVDTENYNGYTYLLEMINRFGYKDSIPNDLHYFVYGLQTKEKDFKDDLFLQKDIDSLLAHCSISDKDFLLFIKETLESMKVGFFYGNHHLREDSIGIKAWEAREEYIEMRIIQNVKESKNLKYVILGYYHSSRIPIGRFTPVYARIKQKLNFPMENVLIVYTKNGKLETSMNKKYHRELQQISRGIEKEKIFLFKESMCPQLSKLYSFFIVIDNAR